MKFATIGSLMMAVGFLLTATIACAPSGFLTRPTLTIPSTSSLPDLSLAPEDVTLYPLSAPGPGGRWLFYRGDRISFDVTPRYLGAIPPEDVTVRIYRLKGTEREVLTKGTIGYPTFDRVPRARMSWVWDTQDAEGRETLIVHLDPDDRVRAGDEDPTNNVVTLTVRFVTDAARPTSEALATWATATTNCCILHYLTCTRAERNLPVLIQATDRAVAFVQEQMGTHLASPLEVYFIGRVVGQGGYALGGIVLSYPDRLYTGEDIEIILRHEATHILDTSLMGPATPALLREGLAVWVAGGHYKPEFIPSRAGALLRRDWYIPLAQLADNFYNHQHEIGYLEAAALVAYLVETYGWDEFLSFYRRAGEPTDMPPANALDSALRHSFGVGLEEMERAFQAWLSGQPTTSEEVRNLELTIRLFNLIRRYQQTNDPMAYFLSGWFPNAAEGKQRRITTDFLRRPRTARATAGELMLVSAQESLRQGNLDETALMVRSVERALEGDFSIPPASEYLAIAQTVADQGSEVQRVEIRGKIAYVWAIPTMGTMACSPPQMWTLYRTDAGWIAGE